jgi:hypothetical protein
MDDYVRIDGMHGEQDFPFGIAYIIICQGCKACLLINTPGSQVKVLVGENLVGEEGGVMGRWKDSKNESKS